LAIRFISKGKGRNRKSFPIRPKKGVTIRSVSLQPSAVQKINKEQIKILNTGQSSTFSKALNSVVMRAKRAGIPIYDSNVNTDGKTKPYHMWITDMKSHKKVKRSDTMVLAKNFGQAVDDYITIWNKENRMNMDIGYPVVQGTGLHPIKNKAEDVFITEDSTKRKRRDKNWNVVRDDRTNYFHGGKAYNVDYDEGLGIISVDERYQDENNVWHTGRNVFFAQGEDGAEIAKQSGGYYINSIMDYLDSAGAL